MPEIKPESQYLEMETRNLYRSRGWLVALLLTSFLVIGATLPAFVDGYLKVIFTAAFSTVCHQFPERSFHINGSQLAVCHRCYGMYSGMWLAVIVFLFLHRWDRQFYRHTPFIIAASLLVPGIDWLGGLFGVWENTTLTRLLTGAIFGFVAGYLLARAFTLAFSKNRGVEMEATVQ